MEPWGRTGRPILTNRSRTKRATMHRNVPRVLTAIGAACLLAMLAVLAIGGVLVLQTKAFLDRAEITTGEVVKVDVRDAEGVEYTDSEGQDRTVFDKEYRPTVRFTPEGGGKPVTVTVDDYGLVSYQVGDAMDVAYDPDDPSHAVPHFGPLNGWDDYVAAGGLGLVAVTLFPFALGLLLAGFFTRRSQSWVRSNGEPVTATITALRPAPAAVDPSNPPWIIEARLTNPKSGELRTVQSRPLAYDARLFFAAGRPITVRLDPRHANRFWVDTSPPTQATPAV